MKYFIDTHDRSKGTFPKEELTEQQFFDNFDALDEAAVEFGAFGHAAHVNLQWERPSASCRDLMRSRSARRMRQSTFLTTRSPR
jgi:hypothetical protein